MNKNIIEISKRLETELLSKGISFTAEGYPIFQKEFILKNIPCAVLPFNHKNSNQEK